MKRFLTAILLAACCFAARAQMQAMFSYSTFYRANDDQPYIETYLLFDAWTLHFLPQAEGGYRASAEVTLVLRSGDSVNYVKKYELKSPVLETLDSLDFSILDLQRFPAANGLYDIDVTLRDMGGAETAATVTEKVVVNYDRKRPTLSSVQLMSSVTPTVQPGMLSRGGFDMEPYVDDYVPEQIGELKYYCEVYNIDKEVGNESFLAMSYVEVLETGRRVESTQKAVRKKPAATVPLLGSVEIGDLPSGNYNLVVELRNRDGQTMLIKRVPFFRSNPSVRHSDLSDFSTTFVGGYNDEEELNLYIDALYPISSELEKRAAQEIVKRPGVEGKQAYLYEFWTRRDAMNAEAEWLKYKKRIDYVQEHFSYPMTRGIVTDRGRVYLQYGPPDYVRDEKNLAVLSFGNTHVLSQGDNTNLGNATNQDRGTIGVTMDDQSVNSKQAFYLPYQLWRYNLLPGDNPNRVFIFWDQFRSGYYTLLNSNAIGEVQEYGWERRLSRNELPEGVEGAVGVQFRRGY